MIIFTEDAEKNSKKIYHKHLQRMAKCIDDFVNIYSKNVYIENRDHYITLLKLKEISRLIKTCQYDRLIEDTSIISYNEPPDDEDIEYPF